MNDPIDTGLATSFITVRSAGNFGGYMRPEVVIPKGTMTRQEAIANIGNLLGGMMGQRLMGIKDDSGWSNDIERARELAERAVTTYGLTDKALTLPVQNGKVLTTHPIVQAEIQKLLAEGEEYAKQRLAEKWPLFGLVAKELIQKGHLDKTRFNELEQLAQTQPHRDRTLHQLTRCQKLLSHLH